jgi:hypothetical protein
MVSCQRPDLRLAQNAACKVWFSMIRQYPPVRVTDSPAVV